MLCLSFFTKNARHKLNSLKIAHVLVLKGVTLQGNFVYANGDQYKGGWKNGVFTFCSLVQLFLIQERNTAKGLTTPNLEFAGYVIFCKKNLHDFSPSMSEIG